ncbi:hypothetical protein HDU79_006649 [Rhizoclosmatium sp. JEL0117]|nr:hypothetical protein HDU79_006649 [Rhizoclosmatium sp. JEL0117]
MISDCSSPSDKAAASAIASLNQGCQQGKSGAISTGSYAAAAVSQTVKSMIEVAIVNHIRKGVENGSFAQPNAEEQACLKGFTSSENLTMPLNFMFWSGLGYFAMDPVNVRKIPIHLKLFGMVAVAAGGFGSTYLLVRRYHRSCLQCIIDSRDKTSDFYKATREIMKQHHPDANDYFKFEKYRLLRETTPATDK